MNSIKETFSDNEGNHILVALNFYDELDKRSTLQIPEEYADIEIVDINISKVHLDKPINHAMFFKMSTWLLHQFESHKNGIFTYICSTDDVISNHGDILPQMYRWTLFDRLFRRLRIAHHINVQDVIVGPQGYTTYGRAFYRDIHAPIVYIVTAYLQDKQQQFYPNDIS